MFLVVQSSLLKHIAMAHFAQPAHARAIYKNHNERLYWIHNVLIQHLYEEFKENYEALDRMYRIFKNYGSKDAVVDKKPGFAMNDRWLYSEVHSGIARACMEIKIALEKCTNLDMFLDSCAINDQELNLDAVNSDIENLIDDLTRVLATTQNSQLRLKNLQRKFAVEEERKKESEVEETEAVVKIEDTLPEIKDEVFFLLKTDDDDERQAIGDVTTAPGKTEREATKLVLNELRRKLVKREDIMRERERQALVKTMPELKDVPEFPRQIRMEDYVERKGYINKIVKTDSKERLFKDYKISSKLKRKKNYRLKVNKYDSDTDIKAKGEVFEANVNLNGKSKLISVSSDNKEIIVTEWNKQLRLPDLDKAGTSFSSIEDINEAVNDSINQSINRSINQSINNVVNQSVNESINEAVNKSDDQSINQLKCSKKDLELSSSSSETDFDYHKERQMLKDIRRHRVARRKNHPVKRVSIDIIDESLRPVEYSFGTGMAIASVLQVNNGKMPNMAAEEVFIGDGEVSNDSGNDEDA
ncbi:hypothetical protein MSG28_014624 [Choristoneura fumiferana]|uniref:Uncharacterized protein n=2 Tax=Choristoneura fumiferana TaxID=7141 RepID=A0ACC0JS05_CHOFU|nr:hypothetical protein MSG28_014624 [Choristoneura fumiferana]